MAYVTVQEFLNSPYGADFQPGADCGVFATSGDVYDFLEYISSIIDLYAGQTFGTGVIQEEFVAKTGQIKLYLRKFPLHSIESITYHPIGSSNLVDGNGYNMNSLTISPSNYTFMKDGRVIFSKALITGALYQATYIAGYKDIPPPIKLATLMLANTYAQSVDTGSVAIPEGGSSTRFVFDKFEENYVDPRQRYDEMNIGIPVTIYSILNRYRYLR
jgi:hypothetical protein